jgi:hypothetical protein
MLNNFHRVVLAVGVLVYVAAAPASAQAPRPPVVAQERFAEDKTATPGSDVATAVNPVPDRVGAFIAYCPTHLAACKDEIMKVDVAAEMTALVANKPGTVCVVPEGVEEGSATKQILAWMDSHKSITTMKTADGIQAAEKDLWHCQAQIGDGTVPGGPPAKTGAFIVYCAKHYAKCANEMVSVSVAVMVPDPPKHCSPPDSISTKEMVTAVLAWLGKHKEADDLDTDEGIERAFDQLWPCH